MCPVSASQGKGSNLLPCSTVLRSLDEGLDRSPLLQEGVRLERVQDSVSIWIDVPENRRSGGGGANRAIYQRVRVGDLGKPLASLVFQSQIDGHDLQSRPPWERRHEFAIWLRNH